MSDNSATSSAASAQPAPEPIRGATELPAQRENIELHTSDGFTLVGELSLPESGHVAASLVTLHPLPTAGGFMDSHIIRKAAARLPALADIAVLRFNFRGVTSPRGTSEGSFGEGTLEEFDLAAAMDFVRERGLPNVWLLGWSFGTEVTLKYGRQHPITGAILLSPPLHRATAEDVSAWAGDERRLVAVIPELDDYLRPHEAAQRFASVPEIDFVAVEGGKHLWVGESQTYRVLTEIVARLNPVVLPLPRTWPPEASAVAESTL
ncbi:alpha/beta hydrolase [Salinibacterium sp. UTAS2018]|uniref:alpha/beta hydrolase n=1 Tax=Salinibacterium sp. UTAS2018 TaxID=2508880 RepID=UPI0010095B20|nr:alpha/beta hydrolase [Salinibacterium sp. UTAS2018]QAV69809.1 alpha/beta hydrolase [Salinibacterium sp. UTAS2018]